MDASKKKYPGPDALIDCCVRSLQQDRERVGRVALGAASEQWFNTELFLALNFGEVKMFDGGVWARPEHQKIDLAIVSSSFPPFEVCGYIESKCVFPNGLHVEPILKLRRQLNREIDGKLLGVPRVGMIFSCWSNYWRTPCEAFQAKIENAIAEIFASQVCVRRPMVSITNQIPIQWQEDAAVVEVALHAIILTPPRFA
ncbi:MAG: hypothetical protein ACTHLN_04755 [Tepidisphaeraceae bacterium]